jgi:hypothetical protein
MDHFFVEECLASLSELCDDQLGFTLCKGLVCMRQSQVDEINQGQSV